MSEHYLYVACTCFHDGRTTEPPFARALLGYDRYGNVKIAKQKSAEDSPEGLWEWREEQACEHRSMRLVDDIYEGPHPRWDHPYVERAIAGEGYEHLQAMLHREVSGDARVFATADEASVALRELLLLLEEPTGITSRVLVNPRGQVSQMIDRDGYDGADEFKQVGADRAYPNVRIEGVCEVGLEGMDFVVRDFGGRDWQTFRSSTLEVFQWGDHETRIGGSALRRTLFLGAQGVRPVMGLAPELRFVRGYPMPSRLEPYVPEVLHVELREQPMADLDYRLAVFRDVLAASVQSGNPIVSYYSGHSLGYEQ